MVQEVMKMMLKTGERGPKLIMKVLNSTERRGGYGTPIKFLFNRNVKGILPELNNEELDIQENLQRKIEKAEKIEARKCCFIREAVVEGDKV